MENEGENRAVISAVKELHQVERHVLKRGDADACDVLSVPKGKELVSVKKFMDEYLDRPERIRGTATLTTLPSFCAHVNRFKDEHSAIFADVQNRQEPKLVAVLDYHLGGSTIEPRFGEHRAVYRFPVSDEWKAWTSRRDPMGQSDFAAFLEDRILDVLDPGSAGKTVLDFAEQLGITLASPQRLMELSRGLSIRVDQRVTQAVNLSTGEAQIGFEEKHGDQAGGPLKVPGGFALAIPVFKSGTVYQVPVRLRYRAKEGGLLWWFSLARTDLIWDDAVNEACEVARLKTELPLFFGTPEV